jgi:hypothetical protein
MESMTRQFSALLTVINEIDADEVDEETGNLIILPRNIVIATIALLPVYQTITLRTQLRRQVHVRGPHLLSPLEREANEACEGSDTFLWETGSFIKLHKSSLQMMVWITSGTSLTTQR